jgi:chloramphenicol O-acetyltransferase type A
MDFPRFLPYAQEEVEQAKNRASIEEHDPVRLFFISSVPWVSYTGLQLPLPSADFSNPQITFGKAYWQEERYLLPLSLNVHHGLCDGIHISAFFQRFEEICKHVAEEGTNRQ